MGLHRRGLAVARRRPNRRIARLKLCMIQVFAWCRRALRPFIMCPCFLERLSMSICSLCNIGPVRRSIRLLCTSSIVLC